MHDSGIPMRFADEATLRDSFLVLIHYFSSNCSGATIRRSTSLGTRMYGTQLTHFKVMFMTLETFELTFCVIFSNYVLLF